MNHKFYQLKVEKQNSIINAGYKIFASYPYKKAPMAAIAEEAAISKSLLFHYFCNKKELYLFLFQTSIEYLHAENKSMNVDELTDFFLLVTNAIRQRAEQMRKYPYIYQFLGIVYYEQNDIIKDELTNIKAARIKLGKDEMLKNVDVSKFKHPQDIDMLFDMILWMSEGYMSDNIGVVFSELDRIVEESTCMLNNLKQNYYKDGYL